MSKLMYPIDGIYKYTSNSLDNLLNSLSNAKSRHLDVPSTCPNRSFLVNLSTTLSNYYNESMNIKEAIIKVNNKYDNLFNNISSDNKKLTDIKIESRDRLIY